MDATAASPNPDVLDAWHALLQVSSRVLRELDRRLDDEHRLSSREFDVMINLDNVPGRRLRMTDLARAVVLSSGGLTRLVGRLEERGFVVREPDADDGRSFHAALTEQGRTRLAEARFTHDAVIAEMIGGSLQDAERPVLTRALTRILASPSSM